MEEIYGGSDLEQDRSSIGVNLGERLRRRELLELALQNPRELRARVALYEINFRKFFHHRSIKLKRNREAYCLRRTSHGP